MRRIIIPSFHVFTEYVHLCVSDTLTRFYSSEPKNNFHMRKENIKTTFNKKDVEGKN